MTLLVRNDLHLSLEGVWPTTDEGPPLAAAVVEEDRIDRGAAALHHTLDLQGYRGGARWRRIGKPRCLVDWPARVLLPNCGDRFIETHLFLVVDGNTTCGEDGCGDSAKRLQELRLSQSQTLYLLFFYRRAV